MNPTDQFVEAIAEAVARKLGPMLGHADPMPTKLLEVKDAAAYLKRSVSSVRKMITKKQIPEHIVKRLGGRIVLIRSELETWLDAPK